MKNIQEKITHFFEIKVVIEKGTPLLLACSGGADSTALFHLLLERQQNFEVLHVNYQLRGAESEQEMQHVQALCEAHSVKLYLYHAEKIENENTQIWARNFRYEKIKVWLAENTKGYALTAHHQKDQAETLLLNLLRGTGPRGMGGIPTERMRIFRPLLDCTREEILSYLTENQLEWCEDSSNLSLKYQRNVLRHEVLPLLETINPKAEAHLADAAFWGGALSDFVAKQVASFLGEHLREVQKNTFFLADKFIFTFSSPPLLAYFWLMPHGFSLLQIREWGEQWATFSYGKRFESAEGWTLQRTRKGWELFKEENGVYEESDIKFFTELVSFSFRGKAYLAEITEEIPPSFVKPKHIFLDAEKLSFPLRLRAWRAGERFSPLGMKGKRQLIADFLMHRKLSPQAKKQAFVLVDAQENVLAIPFFAISEHCKISDNTKQIFILKESSQPERPNS